MRHEFAAEASRFGFREDDRRATLAPRSDTIERLSPGASNHRDRRFVGALLGRADRARNRHKFARLNSAARFQLKKLPGHFREARASFR